MLASVNREKGIKVLSPDESPSRIPEIKCQNILVWKCIYTSANPRKQIQLYLLGKPAKNCIGRYRTKYMNVNMGFPKAGSTGFPLICLLSKHKFPHVELH